LIVLNAFLLLIVLNAFLLFSLLSLEYNNRFNAKSIILAATKASQY